MSLKDLTDKELADEIREGLRIDEKTASAIIEATDRGLTTSVNFWGGRPRGGCEWSGTALQIKPSMHVTITREL